MRYEPIVLALILILFIFALGAALSLISLFVD
ncbi:hypothetical protein PMI33_04259 [Pseudomonas sp. GM67]|nr:hypothetical protein PMI33_04259 [Pseudomonas sp. GM67]